MLTFTIKICRKSQTEPAFPEVTKENFNGEISIHGIAVLEKGMTSGKTSLGITLIDKNGKYYFAQTSVNLMESLMTVVKAAELNWKENPE